MKNRILTLNRRLDTMKKNKSKKIPIMWIRIKMFFLTMIYVWAWPYVFLYFSVGVFGTQWFSVFFIITIFLWLFMTLRFNYKRPKWLINYITIAIFIVDWIQGMVLEGPASFLIPLTALLINLFLDDIIEKREDFNEEKKKKNDKHSIKYVEDIITKKPKHRGRKK